MKIVIVGPGALGCLLAATIAASGENEILLLDHNHARAARLREQGIILATKERLQTFHLPVTAEPADIGRADIIILATKSQAVPAALQHIKPIKTEDSLVVALQNGVLHLDCLREQLSLGQWVAGVTALGASLSAPGQVRFGGQGVTRFGFYPRQVERELPATYCQTARQLADFVKVMNGAGLQTEVSQTIIDHIWGKLLVNVGINALTAIHNCANGGILANPAMRDILIKVVMEGAEVARALQIDIPEDVVRQTLEVCRKTAENISSMLQDVRQKRPTEIDAINGAVVQAAADLGINVPLNRKLVQQIKDLEKNYGVV